MGTALLLLLSGCAEHQDIAMAALAESHPSTPHIHYTSSPPPFCGRCDSVEILVQEDGLVTWQHSYWQEAYRNRRTDNYRWQLSAQNIANFTNALAPFRPSGRQLFNETNCSGYQTDDDMTQIAWHDALRADVLIFDGGCFQSQPLIYRSLANAPFQLGTVRTPGLRRTARSANRPTGAPVKRLSNR